MSASRHPRNFHTTSMKVVVSVFSVGLWAWVFKSEELRRRRERSANRGIGKRQYLYTRRIRREKWAAQEIWRRGCSQQFRLYIFTRLGLYMRFFFATWFGVLDFRGMEVSVSPDEGSGGPMIGQWSETWEIPWNLAAWAEVEKSISITSWTQHLEFPIRQEVCEPIRIST